MKRRPPPSVYRTISARRQAVMHDAEQAAREVMLKAGFTSAEIELELDDYPGRYALPAAIAAVDRRLFGAVPRNMDMIEASTGRLIQYRLSEADRAKRRAMDRGRRRRPRR